MKYERCSKCGKNLLHEEVCFIEGKNKNFFDTVVCYNCVRELKISDYFPNTCFIDT